MSVNAELCEEVADAIEASGRARFEGQGKYGYDQTMVLHACRTPACVAGWTVAVAGVGAAKAECCDVRKVTKFSVMEDAKELLALNEGQAADLFTCYPYYPDGGVPMKGGLFPSPADAARTLRRLAETGVVDWSREEPGDGPRAGEA